MSVWLLRGILALALATLVSQAGAIVLKEQMVGKVEPTPSEQPVEPKPDPLPGPFPSGDPTVEPTPEPTPPPDVEIDVDLPPLLIVTTTPLPAVPPPPTPILTLPDCVPPGGSGDAQGHRQGWPEQGRSCAGKR